MFKPIRIDAPGWLIATMYISIGWIALIATPELVDRLAIAAVGALASGGILYSVGAVIYARKHPTRYGRCSATTSCFACW